MIRHILIVPVVLLLSLSSLAKTPSSTKTKDDKRKPNQEINYTVYSENYPKDQLGGPVNATTQETAVLNPGHRDMLLSQAGLTKHVGSWDHLDKDMLILRASKKSLPTLRTQYPILPAGSLAQLQSLLKAGK